MVSTRLKYDYQSNWIISPGIGAENKEYSKPPPSYLAKLQYFTNLDFPEIRNKGSHFPSKKLPFP